MKFGGLSENEVKKISAILEIEGVAFEVGIDESILQSNKESMRYNLRHRNPPDLSTNILAINVADNIFDKLSEAGKEKLLTFGITDKAPSPEDFASVPGQLYNQNKKLQFFHYISKVIIFAAALFIAYLLVRNMTG